MSENKKAIDMTPEELEQWIKFLPAPEDDSSYFYFSDPDPYFKFEQKARRTAQQPLVQS